jgi:hypothetical protein
LGITSLYIEIKLRIAVAGVSGTFISFIMKSVVFPGSGYLRPAGPSLSGKAVDKNDEIHQD